MTKDKILLSVVLATRNEEANIGDCIRSVRGIADEIIIVDEESTDKTREIAKSLGANVYIEPHHEIFHITKQKAIDNASGKWILQLDADERVTQELSYEIAKVIKMHDTALDNYISDITKLPKYNLFKRHQKLVEERDGKIGTNSGQICAFFIARKNLFLGKYLTYGGTYPDGVIRLVRNGYAKFPAKDVHEQMEINGRVEWLMSDLLHLDSPTFTKYLSRNSRYIDLLAKELMENKKSKNISNFISYFFVKPISWFLVTQIRHKGVLDGWRGILFSFFSALRFPRGYYRYLKNNK